MDRLKEEFDALGFYLSAHPLDAYAKSLRRLGVRRYTDILAEGIQNVDPGDFAPGHLATNSGLIDAMVAKSVIGGQYADGSQKDGFLK